MNPVTFNDFLPRTDGDMVPQALEKVKLSPLIEWVDDSEIDFDVLSAPEAFYPNGCPRLPFQQFRVDGRYMVLEEGGLKFKAWVLAYEEEGSGFSMLFNMEKFGHRVDKIFYFESKYPSRSMSIGELPMVDFRAALFDRKGRRLEYPKGPDGSIIEESIVLVHGWLAKLAMDFHNPHLHLCKKAPTIPSGKTVTWQKAREHYVLLHKNHAANSRGANGKRVIQDSNPNRCAHSRRAHYRLLSSPRFKNRVGQRVWVKSSWVGPKEWEDRSGQIYKIVG